MELTLKAERLTGRSTISRLEVDGQPECFILEDTVREVPGQPVESGKIHAEKSIPAGRYEIVRTMSTRFKKMLPLLVGVPGYQGVRIHPGNFPANTEGCLLPGTGQAEDAVTHSVVAFEALDDKIAEALEAGEQCFITMSREIEE